MRFARALLASLGASTCLVLAGTLAMATLSTVVAFSGLPGIRADTTSSLPATVLAAAEPDAGAAAPPALALPPVRATDSLAAASAVADPRVADAGAATGGVITRTATDPVPQAGLEPDAGTATNVPGAGSAPSPPPAAPQASGSPKAPAGSATPGGPLRDVGTAVGDTVLGAGQGVADAVTPVAPRAASGVDALGGVAGGTAKSATNAGAAVLDGITGG